MKTVTITIQVPDGTDIKVSQGGEDKPFVERDPGPQPEGFCPVHGYEWELVPAGFSKRTQKRYNAFWSCPEKGCNEKPQRERVIEEVMPF